MQFICKTHLFLHFAVARRVTIIPGKMALLCPKHLRCSSAAIMALNITDIWNIFKAVVKYLLGQISEYTCSFKDNLIAAFVLVFAVLIVILILVIKLCCCCGFCCGGPKYQRVVQLRERVEEKDWWQWEQSLGLNSPSDTKLFNGFYSWRQIDIKFANLFWLDLFEMSVTPCLVCRRQSTASGQLV